jgi:hypothetical protein
MDEMVAADAQPERRNGATPDWTRVSGNVLAVHFGCTRQNIARLAAEGVLEREADGLYNQDRCRLRYLAHLRAALRHSPRSVATARVAELRAKKLLHEIAAYEGVHMMTDEALAFVDELVGGVLRPRLGSLPAAIAGRDLLLRRRIEAAVDTMLAAIADKADEFARSKRPS